MTEVDVLIAGGGPTGLVLACELARRGVGCRIVDRSAEFFGGSRADGLQPRSLEVFDDLGVLDAVLAAGDTGTPVRGYQGDTVIWEGRMAELFEPTPDVPYPNPWFVPQYRTEEILRGHLGGWGVHVERATELVDLTQDSGAVVATLTRHGVTEQVRARYLVGADGGGSTVRGTLGIGFPGETDDATRMLLADVRIPGWSRDHVRIWSAGTAEAVTLMPLAGTDLFTLVVPPPPEDGTEPLPDYLSRLMAEASGRDDIRLDEVRWSTRWRANMRLAERFRAGRVLLAGDAAHVCHPTGGQGMNTGIQDAYNLGWKLAAVLGGAPAELLDSYEAERRPAAEAALVIGAELLSGHQRGDADAYRRGREVHQLGLHYQNGPLARELRAVPGRLRAGDRAPDAPCRDADGRPTRLFEVFRGPQWTVLCFGQDQAGVAAELGDRYGDLLRSWLIVPADAPAGERVLVDAAGHAHAGYDVSGSALFLVRPDGYLGMCGDRGGAGQVADYLCLVTNQVTTGPR